MTFLGKAIKDARTHQGLTKAQLAEEIGVDERTIRRWENGESIPMPIFLRLIEQNLGMEKASVSASAS